DAGVLHLVGQAPQDLRHAVLHVDGGEVDVALEVERHGDGARAVVAAGGLDVAHPLDAVDALLEGRGDRRLDHLRVRARIYRRHRHLRVGELGVLRDRQRRDGDRPADDGEDRAHAGEHRPPDEEVDEHRASYFSAAMGAPSPSFCRPLTTTFSPALRPESTTYALAVSAPSATARCWATSAPSWLSAT